MECVFRCEGEVTDVKKIAIFQYEWLLQIHTLNLVVGLVRSGHHVDLFLVNCERKFADLTPLAGLPGVTVYDFSYEHFLISAAERTIGRRQVRKDSAVLPEMVRRAAEIVRKGTYACCIGIEKKGLIWAGKVAEITGTPVIYYSLELYLDDHLGDGDFSIFGDPGFRGLRAEEKFYHQRSAATIIQDRQRADALLAGNGIAATTVLFLPVTILGKAHRKKSYRLHDSAGVSRQMDIILNFGVIDANRRCFELAHAARLLSPNCALVMHGYIDSDDVRLLSDKDAFPGVVLSAELVPEEELQYLIASASVGLVFYGEEVANSRLTAFASEKLARYLQAGVPIIACDMGNYRVLMDRFACGRLITAMEELPAAVDTILADYGRYSDNALAAFNEIYSFDANFEKIVRFISENFSGRARTGTGNADDKDGHDGELS